jgi:hypothetical protein
MSVSCSCTVCYNTATNKAGILYSDYCCTTPFPTNGISSITGPPLLLDMAAG